MAMAKIGRLVWICLWAWVAPVSAQDMAAATPDSTTQDTAAENWNAKFQSTYIWQHKPGFNAPYSGPHSLSPNPENAYTFTATAAFGKRLWDSGELYFDPEVAQGVPMSNLNGLGGFYNGELTRASGTHP